MYKIKSSAKIKNYNISFIKHLDSLLPTTTATSSYEIIFLFSKNNTAISNVRTPGSGGNGRSRIVVVIDTMWILFFQKY